MSAPLPGPVITVAVVADTHIPDRVSGLHPGLLPALRAAAPARILHAGDICARRVLSALAEVAPVSAARGNRDFFAGPLRAVERLEIGGVSLALTHGHGSWANYLRDKLHYWREGYRLERYTAPLLRDETAAQVIVFGHTHHAEALWRGPQLLLNPGSASFGARRGWPPVFALLHIYPGGALTVEFIALRGWKIVEKRWQPAPPYGEKKGIASLA